jgi:hypothetical protein
MTVQAQGKAIPFTALWLALAFITAGCTVVVRPGVVVRNAPRPALGIGRIAYLQGQAQIQVEGDREWSLAFVNLPVRQGDRYWNPEASRMELQFNDGTSLRMGEQTSADVLRLDQNLLQIHLAAGHLYFHTGRARNASVQVELAEGTLLAWQDARFRVDLQPDNTEEISVFRGSVQVTGDGQQIDVRPGERLIWNNGSAEITSPNQPDEWEHWNHERDHWEDADHHAYLPPELASYAGDLDENGDWIHTEYGYGWRPRAVNDGWAPYRAGRWSYMNGDYVWVSDENWGWIPYHYGRWVYSSEGWCWVPPAAGDVYWGPGYVGWIRTSNHVAWVPLAPHEVYYGYGHYGRDSVNLSEHPNAPVRGSYRYGSINQAVSGVPQNNFGAVHSVPTQIQVNHSAPGAYQPVGRPAVNAATVPTRIGAPAPANLQPSPALSAVTVNQLRQNHPQAPAPGTNAAQPNGQRQAPAPIANTGRPSQAPQNQTPPALTPQTQAPHGQMPQSQTVPAQVPQSQQPQGRPAQIQVPQRQIPLAQTVPAQVPQNQQPQGRPSQTQVPAQIPQGQIPQAPAVPTQVSQNQLSQQRPQAQDQVLPGSPASLKTPPAKIAAGGPQPGPHPGAVPANRGQKPAMLATMAPKRKDANPKKLPDKNKKNAEGQPTETAPKK